MSMLGSPTVLMTGPAANHSIFSNNSLIFTQTKAMNALPPYSFVPFGGGPRMCPGNEFARIEVLVAMHYIVRQFRWEMCCREESYKKDPTPTPVLGLPIELATRRFPENALS